MSLNGTVLYQAKGDNNPSPDPELLTKSQIKAKVVTMNNNSLVIPQIGYITLWLNHHEGKKSATS